MPPCATTACLIPNRLVAFAHAEGGATVAFITKNKISNQVAYSGKAVARYTTLFLALEAAISYKGHVL